MKFPAFLKRRKLLKNKDVTGVWRRADGAALVRVSRQGGAPRLQLCRFLEGQDPKILGRELAGTVSEDRSLAAYCVAVLDVDEYDLKQIEPPDVPDAELKDAMRWQVKDLIDFDLEEAVTDIFPVPELPYRKEERNFWVAVAHQDQIWPHVHLLRRAEMNLLAIDIPELALRNIAELLPENAEGVAIVHLGLERGAISIYRGGRLYLSRQIRLRLPELSEGKEEDLEFLALEIQRSLEFYDSHFAQPPVAGLYVAPPEMPITRLLPYLQERFGDEVRPLDLGTILQGPELPEAQYGRCLLAIGAALRQEQG